MNVQQLENELWEAADQLRANSKLTAAEYAMPVLGLIFLRHADNRFKTYRPEIEADIPPQVPAAQREALIKLGFQGKAAIYLPEEARFDRIASLPQGASVGEIIDAAMDAIEAEYEVLKGALPRGYTAFEPDLLADLVKIFDRPAIKAATGAISNANSLWIQYFYSYLNDTGRAGFVMASSASDAGNKDRDIREKLVRTGHVDAMIAIGNKFFYTRSLPCTLWFFDKGKSAARQDQVLMIDARNVYHVVSARSHVFTDEQLANLTAIAWLYRGETTKFVTLLGRYQRQVDDWLAELPEHLAADTAAIQALAAPLATFADKATLAELNADLPDDAHISPAALDAFKVELASAQADTQTGDAIAALLAACAEVRQAIAAADLAQHSAQVTLQARLDALAPQLKATGKTLEARHKHWLKLLDTTEKTLRARLAKAWDGKAAREARRTLLAADTRKNEAPTVRDAALDALKQATYFIHQGHWLHSRFPNATFENVPGLCKAVTLEEIAANDYSLTPGRYVGVATAEAEDDEDFAEKLREIHDELAELNDKAVELAARIGGNLEELLG